MNKLVINKDLLQRVMIGHSYVGLDVLLAKRNVVSTLVTC